MQIGLGNSLYLHSSGTSPSSGQCHLLISSHGSAERAGSFAVPAWTSLHFYGPHGAALQDPGIRSIMMGVRKVTETIQPGSTCTDYILAKFQGRHNGVGETYSSIRDEVRSNSSYLNALASGTAKADPWCYSSVHFDVLTIRNRWNAHTIRLSWALQQLEHAGRRYDNIHCLFCRSLRGGETVDTQFIDL